QTRRRYPHVGQQEWIVQIRRRWREEPPRLRSFREPAGAQHPCGRHGDAERRTQRRRAAWLRVGNDPLHGWSFMMSYCCIREEDLISRYPAPMTPAPMT